MMKQRRLKRRFFDTIDLFTVCMLLAVCVLITGCSKSPSDGDQGGAASTHQATLAVFIKFREMTLHSLL